MTCAIRIVNDGNCLEDEVTIHYGPDHAQHQTLALGDVSGRLSAEQTIRVEAVHKGQSVGQVEVITWHDAETRAREAYVCYGDAVGWTTYDGHGLPLFEELGDRQKAGWAAAGGVPGRRNPWMRDGGG